ncbi:MAG TPA: hypothetical protein VK861_08380, partial [Bacteroidales bacterium]|nr:hypothetical protein [Bacteroidales bacterium]
IIISSLNILQKFKVDNVWYLLYYTQRCESFATTGGKENEKKIIDPDIHAGRYGIICRVWN